MIVYAININGELLAIFPTSLKEACKMAGIGYRTALTRKFEEQKEFFRNRKGEFVILTKGEVLRMKAKNVTGKGQFRRLARK